jgi:hypothetical protein
MHYANRVYFSVLAQTAIISLYNIYLPVFITETECVYCAVRTESLNIGQDNVNR